jgi:hypothetical protein
VRRERSCFARVHVLICRSYQVAWCPVRKDRINLVRSGAIPSRFIYRPKLTASAVNCGANIMSRASGGQDHRQLPRTPYVQTSNVQSGSTLSNRNAMTIFRSAEISFILQSLHACTKYLLDKSRTAGGFSFANAFHRARGISPSRGVMTARFRPMEKVEVAAGNSRRMEARLSHWHNGYARRSSRLGGAVSTECAREHLRTSANSWQHAEVRGN